jgi:hypothetical protein
MKWLLCAAILLLLGGVVYQQRSTTKTAYVNGLPEYNQLPGKEYIFQRDCYIFKFKDRDTDWPLVASNLTVPALPPVVDAKNIGANLPGVRILGVVRTGWIVRLASVRRDEGTQGTTITYELLILDEGEKVYTRLDATHLLDHTPEKSGAAPSFLPEYVAPRIKK